MNAFTWRDTPSQTGPKMPDSFRKPNLKPKRLHVYAEASASDASREAEIEQTNKEIEYHFALAQKVTDDVMRGYHRDEARRLAAKVRGLVLGRSASFVAKLEQERGLA
jgi:hypothetical protein